jgi:hypothetical protein
MSDIGHTNLLVFTLTMQTTCKLHTVEYNGRQGRVLYEFFNHSSSFEEHIIRKTDDGDGNYGEKEYPDEFISF